MVSPAYQIKVLGNNMENVYKHVPKEMLPVEYLPDDYTGPNAGTVQELAGIDCRKCRLQKTRSCAGRHLDTLVVHNIQFKIK